MEKIIEIKSDREKNDSSRHTYRFEWPIAGVAMHGNFWRPFSKSLRSVPIHVKNRSAIQQQRVDDATLDSSSDLRSLFLPYMQVHLVNRNPRPSIYRV